LIDDAKDDLGLDSTGWQSGAMMVTIKTDYYLWNKELPAVLFSTGKLEYLILCDNFSRDAAFRETLRIREARTDPVVRLCEIEKPHV